LRKQIIDAFKDIPNPGKKFKRHFDAPGPKYDLSLPSAAKYFLSRTWQQCDGKTLHFESDALSWFSEKGFCYWLPAYLIAALDEPHEIDTTIDFVIWSIAGLHRDKPRNLNPLMSAQFDALEAFLVYFLEVEHEEWECDHYDDSLDEVRRQRRALNR